ncbi:family 16 glycosylhydrolase [Reichenbachiella carrageenanivorans]|uniref:Family 16 glycosylhydrolase n=1 Tax=Reichenbachiella carrageenanivorans TaxID=2979869 RepID=A0ABY6CVG4_9BACT|nr:family 16 glycosylhydrolase [Reichenbachiella carrageenanivorans]UXX77858.1 family 16 glycosylhydrolase [Reichenbachiella carrageenanivorans]
MSNYLFYIIYFAWLVLAPLAISAQPQGGGQWVAVAELTDEFDGLSLDSSKWDSYHPHWQGRPPSKFIPDNTVVKDGYLQLRASVLQNPSTVANPSQDLWVGAAACVSKGWSAKPGYYYEARIKASDLSMTSSFWFRVGQYSEIDVLEHIGHASNDRSKTLGKDLSYQYHSNTFYYGSHQGLKLKNAESPLKERGREVFHVFGFWWKDAETLLFYLDGKLVHEIAPRVPFAENLKMIFDTEVFAEYSGEFGMPGLPRVENLTDSTKNTMYVDYVRTYKMIKK